MTREEAIRIIEANCSCSESKLKEACAIFIPELAESEDEKKVNHLHNWMKAFGGAEEYTEKVYQWLKGLLDKQKEQKPSIWTEEDEKNLNELLAWGETRLGLRRWIAGLPEKIKGLQQKPVEDIAKEITKDKDSAIRFLKAAGIMNENGELAEIYRSEQKEQKPVEWSEEEFEFFRRTLAKEAFLDEITSVRVAKKLLNKIKSLHPVKQEWSENDEKMLNEICANLYTSPETREKWQRFLKSLRPQPRQEWTEDDKIAFGVVKGVFEKHGVNLLGYPSIMHWLGKLPHRFPTIKKQGLEKEDKEMIKFLILNIGNHQYFGGKDSHSIIIWLNSLYYKL